MRDGSFRHSGKGVIDVNRDHGWRLEGYHQVKISDCFSKGLVSNASICARYLDVYRCGALVEYFQIWEIRADSLGFSVGWLV